MLLPQSAQYYSADIFYSITMDGLILHMIRNTQFNWGSPYQNATQFTSYTLFCYASSITNKGLHTILVTCDLFPVAMTSFRSAASLLLEPLMNIYSRRESYSILPEKEITEG